MIGKNVMWACMCATAPFMCAKSADDMGVTSSDTIEYSLPAKLLDEITVKAAPVISRTDGMTVRPSQEMLRTSADGIDLLRKLQLSRITVNPLTNSVEVTGGGDVVLCINGVEASQAQIAAVRPQDILRIEYRDSPGIRYAGASVVIDYIVSRHDDGGFMMVDAFGALAGGRWASIAHAAGQYNRGCSVWSLNAGYFGQRKDQWQRDYDETWHYPGTSLVRHEEGLPVIVSAHGFESAVNYNYQTSSGSVFNARIGFDLDKVPNKEEGDRRGMLYTSDSDLPVLVTEHTEERSVSPNAGLYYRYALSETGSLTLDAQSSYMRSNMLHEYAEDGNGVSLRVRGDRFAMKFAGMYECRNGNRVWGVAASNSSSFISNTYMGEAPVGIRVRQSETALMAEYADRFGRFGVKGNLRAVCRYLGQTGNHLVKLAMLPEANISYRPSDNLYIRYSASVDYKMPTAAAVSDVAQPIQAGMIRRGNPELQPFRIVDQSFDASFSSRMTDVGVRLEYRNENNPVMESVIFENNEFVRTYYNQRSFQRLILGGSVVFRPWEDHLSVSVEPVLTRYFSHGIDYRHCHNIFRVGVGVDFSYGHWLAYGNIMSGPANYMYGEEIIEEKDMNQILIGYKADKWTIHAGVFNAFMKDYWMESRNLSALAPYTSKAHSARSSSYVAVKFSLSLAFGRQTREVDISGNGIDNDSGILTGIK